MYVCMCVCVIWDDKQREKVSAENNKDEKRTK